MTSITKKIENRIRFFLKSDSSVLPTQELIKTELVRSDKLHLGCGDVRMPDFINIDFRKTSATDIVNDCTTIDIFPKESLSVVYSNAFFEHLYKNDRSRCLKSVYQSLKDAGVVIFLGIPNFKEVAKAYLQKEKGLLSETFDLYHVYRFTHGDPEHVKGWWLEQLHKSLFDRDEVASLLDSSGFKDYSIFNYCFREEHLAITLGFVAFKQKPKETIDKDWLKKYISQFSKDVNLNSIDII